MEPKHTVSIDPKFEPTIKRFNEYQKKCNENTIRLREKFKKEALNKFINKKPYTKPDNRSSSVKKKEFYERLKTSEEKQKKKRQELIQERKRQLSERKIKEKKFNQEEVKKRVDEMYEWNERRKEKIKLLAMHEKLSQFFKPQILRNSKKMAQRHLSRSTDSAFERLYKDDVKRKEKNEVLKGVFMPDFKPKINKKESSVDNRDLQVSDYGDFMTNVDIENMLRVRVNKKRYKRSKTDV